MYIQLKRTTHTLTNIYNTRASFIGRPTKVKSNVKVNTVAMIEVILTKTNEDAVKANVEVKFTADSSYIYLYTKGENDAND